MSTDTAPPTPDPGGPSGPADGSAAPVAFVVTGGGEPTDAQRTAIATALGHLADEAAEVAAAGHAGRVPPWTRAALAEGARRVRFTSPWQLP